MLKTKLAKIKFYFPKTSNQIKSKKYLVRFIINALRRDGGMNYAGYLKEGDLYNDLFSSMGDSSIAKHRIFLTNHEKQHITKNILTAIEKCQKTLPHPDLPVFIYIYPWLPNQKDQIQFQGVMALAAYYTIHLFIDLNSYSIKSIKETIAHEWNHLVFSQYHQEFKHTLYTHLIKEGFAEVFREEVFGGNSAPWSVALTRTEIERSLKILQPQLRSKNLRLYKSVFYGSKNYKRWTGYSIGYWLAKNFRKKVHTLSWKKIIQTKIEDIIADYL